MSYLALTLMGWVSWPLYIFVFLASLSALWWPNIWPKMGSPLLFEKTIGSIPFTSGIYLYGVSILTPIHFRVPSLISGLLVAKYLAENGVSGFFWKKLLVPFITYMAFTLRGESLDPLNPKMGFLEPFEKLFAQFISYLAFTLMVAHDCKIEIFIGYFWMRWVVIRAGVCCPHLWAQLVCSSGVVVRSTGAYEKLSGHPARPVLGWMARVECPFPSHYTCQAVQSGNQESISWLSTVLRKRSKIEVPPTWCSMPGGVKDTTQGVKV